MDTSAERSRDQSRGAIRWCAVIHRVTGLMISITSRGAGRNTVSVIYNCPCFPSPSWGSHIKTNHCPHTLGQMFVLQVTRSRVVERVSVQEQHCVFTRYKAS